MPHTINDCPRRQSPAANTPSMLVEYFYPTDQYHHRKLSRGMSHLLWGLHVRPAVLFYTKCFDRLWLWTKESQSQKYKLCREELFRVWDLFHLPSPSRVLCPFHTHWRRILRQSKEGKSITYQCLIQPVFRSHPQQNLSSRCNILEGLMTFS